MRTLETSRNIINSEEVEQWLSSKFAERYPALVTWINSVVRKWIVKKAPVVVVTDIDPINLPDWLRTAMQKGDLPERIVLEDALQNRIQPVLDYMAELVYSKADANIAALGFDAAEQRSIKWHEQLVKNASKEPLQEDGSDVVKLYPDGYTWRTVLGKDAMIREGTIMGHCVGRLSYHTQVIRAKLEIVSLRDIKNIPHVTIEIGKQGTAIVQIKGKSNLVVIEKYLPYVEDFLKSRTWKSVNFDGAEVLREKINTYQIFRGKPWFEFDGYRAGLNPSNYGSNTLRLTLALVDDDTSLGTFNLVTDEGIQMLTDVEVQDQGSDADAFFLELCRVKSVLMAQTSKFADTLKPHLKFSKNEGWCNAVDDFTKNYLLAIIGDADAKVYTEKRNIVAWYVASTNDLYLGKDNNKAACEDIAIKLAIAANCFHTGYDFCKTKDFVADINMTAWLKKMLAGLSINTETDESLLNSLLLALKQPDAKEIKAGYLKLKNKAVVSDSDFKTLGFAIGGRAINAIGIVLLCTLPILNKSPFRSYVFNKPNTLNCWLEALSKPDHLKMSLANYGLTEDTVSKVLALLRNEFLRLVPEDKELKELDLDDGIEIKIKQAALKSTSYRQDKARSKILWSAL